MPDLNAVSYLDPLLSSRVNGTINAGSLPYAIAFNEKNDKIYVANRGEDTISVIDGLTNNLTKKIPLKNKPYLMGINTLTNVIYVFHVDTNTYSVIDGNSDEVVVGTRYDVTPKGSGHIRCNSNEIPINRHIMLPLNTICSAEPNGGYTFSHWSQNLGQNSSIRLTEPINTNPFLSFLNNFPFGKSDNSNLNIGKNGNFTANFQTVPPPIPPEFWIPLYGIIVSSIVGYSIPSIITWIKSKRDGKRLHKFHTKINLLYDDGKLDQDDIQNLDNIRNKISDEYSKGRINDQHYTNLKNETSMLYEQIYDKKIDLLRDIPSEKDRLKALDEISRNISDSFAKEKLNETHYNLLNEEIAKIAGDIKVKEDST